MSADSPAGRHVVPTRRSEPRIHSHVTDRLPPDHPLATRRIYCDRCETLLHLQTNSCMRTWIESGRGNYCMRCFIVAAGGLAPDETRLAGVDCLSRSFGFDARSRQDEVSRPRAC
jgi:hypothetical protein